MRRMNLISVLVFGMFAVTGTAILEACASNEPGPAPDPASSSTGTGIGGGVGGTEIGGKGGGGAGTGGYVPIHSGDPDVATDGGADALPPACAMIENKDPVVLMLSADDSNSMASPVFCRDMLAIGIEPVRSQVRTYEFLNYYRMPYPAPNPDPLKFYAELEERAILGTYDFQIGLRSFDVQQRRPINLTFVVDTSGSMQGPGIKNARAALIAAAGQLAAGDRLSVVTWSSANNVLLDGLVVSGPSDPMALAAAESLEAVGNSDLSKGLKAGLLLAEQYRDNDRMNRVVLISDGGANLSVTDDELIAQSAEDAMREGIYLIGVGTGPPLSYNDKLMNTVTERGHGAYVYLDSTDEATLMFGPKRFDETMEIAAREVSVTITLPWYFRVQKFYGEAISAQEFTDVEPQHLAPNDAMVFHQVLAACDPSVIVPSDPVHFEAKWKDPKTYDMATTVYDGTVSDLLSAPKIALPKGRAVVAFAESLKAPSSPVLHAALDLANKALETMPDDEELKSIVALIQKHPQF